MNVLITGVTGFLGSELARTILERHEFERIFLVIRPTIDCSPEARFRNLVERWRRFSLVKDDLQLKKIQLIEHDLEGSEPLRCAAPVDVIHHFAASTQLNLPLRMSRRANVYTTQKMLRFARRQPNLKRFLHYSTAYVAGTRTGLVREDDRAERFNNAYEKSKLEAEDCVKESGIPYTILRPSIVVGRSDTGYFWQMKVLYSVWRVWLMGKIPRAPLDPKSSVDFVPVDYVIDASLSLAEKDDALGNVFQLCAGRKMVSPKEVMLCARDVFQVDIPPLSPPWIVDVLNAPILRPVVPRGILDVLDTMRWHMPYMGKRDRLFSTQAADQLLAAKGITCPAFAEYGRSLFEFCYRTRWGKLPISQGGPCLPSRSTAKSHG